VPPKPSYKNVRKAVRDCRACDLWEGATQAVMREGSVHAGPMLVGEQPGDREDIEGPPFVGPAGRILDLGLERAVTGRDEVYVTNAVKHFRYKLRDKRRIHRKPDRWQVAACCPWLEADRGVVVAVGHGTVLPETIARPALGVCGPLGWGSDKAANPKERSSNMGLTDKVSGKVKQAAGDLVGDADLRRQGKQEERKGEAREELARAQQMADRKAEEVANLERKTS
jgi:uncharacterized protein YjbJ (UPF0337 family)